MDSAYQGSEKRKFARTKVKFTLINFYADQEKQVKLINMTGEVCNSTLVENDEHRLGISFTEISEEDKSAIADFVKMAMKR